MAICKQIFEWVTEYKVKLYIDFPSVKAPKAQFGHKNEKNILKYSKQFK